MSAPAEPVPLQPPEPPRGRRLWRYLVVTACVTVAVCLVAYVLARRVISAAEDVVRRHRARLPAERAALERLGRTRPAFDEPAAGDAHDVLDAYLAAVDLVPATALAVAKRARTPNDEPPADAEVDAILAANPRPAATLERLRRAPASRPPTVLDLDARGRRVDRFVRGLDWLHALVTRAAAKGRTSDALAFSLDLAVLGEDLRRDGSIMDAEVGAQAEKSGAEAILRVVSRIDADSARDTGRCLDVLEAARTRVETVAEVERTNGRLLLLALRDEGEANGAIHPAVGWRRAWSITVVAAEALETWDAAIDARASIASATPDDALAMRDGLRALPEPENLLLRFQLAYWGLWRQGAKGHAPLRVVRAALAVAEHRSRKGTLPKSLADLVPGFLPAVPLDPWDGKPLRYVDGKVWSVGEDGIDDGGRPTVEEEAESGDVVAPAPRRR